MAKFITLHSENGGVLHTNPETWMHFAPTMVTGTTRDAKGKTQSAEMTVIRYVDGSTSRVTESADDVARLASKA